jgi:ankyrin repeat protein
MDFRLKRLYEGAYANDVHSLNELLEEDNLLLDRVVTTTEVTDNPLHVAAFLGHAGFTKEIIQRKPKLAREFNEQGMSPLHLASAEGHLQVVEVLLEVFLVPLFRLPISYCF